MKKNIFFHLFLLFIPLTVQAQTIAEFIKAGESLNLEWVQQKITRPQAPNYPLYPDQFQQGDWEIRFSLQLFRGKDGQVEGQIESVSFIHFSGAKWGTVEPLMADTRFQEKNPDVYTFYFNELTGLTFLADGSPAAYAAFQSALELKLEKAIAACSGTQQRRSQIQSLELPEALQEKHWSAFLSALLARDLPSEAYHLPLSIKKNGKQWLCNYFRLNYPPKTSLLEGKIRNQATEAVRLQFYKEGTWLDYWQDSLLTLDSDGHFKVAFPLGQARMVSFSHGYHTMRFYLEPGDHLSFTTDANAFYRAMKFEGGAAAHQQFLLDFYHEMRGDTLFRSYDHQLLQKEQLPFLAEQLQKESRELAFLELKGRSLSPGFQSIMDRNIRFHYAHILWEAAYGFHIAGKEPLDVKFAKEAEQRRPLLYRLPPGKTYDFFVEEYLHFQLARLEVIGLDLIRQSSPELVFLDIAMPLGSGFDLLESLPEITFDIIFVTAYDQYALRAIKFAAVDYLLKPIDILELKKAVARVIAKRESSQENERLKVLLHNLQKPDQKIALPQSDHIAFVSVNSIIRCRGDRNYTYFYFKGGSSLLVSRTLKEFTELLEGQQFYRVHQSHLVNLNCIEKYSKRDGGTLITTDNEQIPVARARKEQLLALCRERWGME